MEKTNFYSRPGESRVIHSRRPSKGEPADYEETRQSDMRRTTPGLLAMLPGTSRGTHVLMLAGISTSSLVSLLVSPTSLELLDGIWRKSGSPPYYEVLVEAEIEGSSVLRVRPAQLRPVDPKEW